MVILVGRVEIFISSENCCLKTKENTYSHRPTHTESEEKRTEKQRNSTFPFSHAVWWKFRFLLRAF